jgi:undecaprenyl diphosphate synthase
MDGNGRWAERRGLPRVEGHRAGEEAIMRTVRECVRLGLPWLTLFAFSTENWGRPPEEVEFLVNMSRDVLQRRLEEFNSLGVRMFHLGLREGLPEDVLRWFDLAAAATEGNSSLTLSIAFNYGGRREIFEAAAKLAMDIASGSLDPGMADEAEISRRLYRPEMPDVDLLIRTGGEKRLSNFMLWQCAYAELFFCDTLWPDFGAGDLAGALDEYSRRNRKFGAISG